MKYARVSSAKGHFSGFSKTAFILLMFVLASLNGVGLYWINRPGVAEFNAEANTQFSAKNYQEAINIYDRAIDLAPGLKELYRNRAMAYLAMGNYNKAIADFTKALDGNSGDSDSLQARAYAYLYSERYRQAIGDIDQLLQNQKENPYLYNLKSVAYAYNDQFPQALTDLNTALKLSSDPAFVFNRGVTYMKVLNFEGALEDFSTYIKQRPSESKGLMFRANTYLALKSYPQALADLESFLNANPPQEGIAQALYTKGLVLVKLNKKQEAITAFSEACAKPHPEACAMSDSLDK
ncbi:MAG: tetratricopeptide repeat protein [SAR324 cluster bacterium]|nr:tetratricopeptide repeat protein [SAR324 cluster bacterium]